ncbi:hypothetical protein C0991_001331 [Blastosporella zonata]|nr:hypothetical protein C0991_001331 [Blastosporella zonata]
MAPDQIPQSLSSLPRELLDEILSELDQVHDLLSLAFTSRRNANIVIPQHTEYRKIRVRTTMPAMWAHLAQRADLARNIREVELCARQDYTAPDRFPVTLVDNAYHHDDEQKRVEHMCAALGHMKRLATFVWQYEPDLWDVTGLESLSLLGTAWTNRSNSADVIRLIQRSPNIEYLEVPMELSGLDTCHLPRLKRVGLPMLFGAMTAAHLAGGVVADPVIGFLQNNSTIQELNWSPTLGFGLSPESLPNLLCLRGSADVIRPSEIPDSTLHRPVECLDLWDTDSDRLSTLRFLDASALRKLRIAHVGSLDSLYAIAERFTGITWLRLPDTSTSFNQSLALTLDLDQLLDVLSCFASLEVFRGTALWDAVGGKTQKERMHQAILDLVERCPRLCQLDHCSYSEKREAVKLIKIYRKEGADGSLEQVWYEIHRSPPR